MDLKEAVRLFRLAAEQGEAKAQFNLGVMYAEGQGVPQDFKEAMEWYQLGGHAGRRRCLSQPGSDVRQGRRES